MNDVVEMMFHGEEFRGNELVGSARSGNGVFDDFADTARCAAEDEDAVGKEDGFLEVVGDEQDRDVHFFPDLQEVILHLGTREGVEGAEGFIHDEDAGFVGQCPGDGDALFHAAAEFVRV